VAPEETDSTKHKSEAGYAIPPSPGVQNTWPLSQLQRVELQEGKINIVNTQILAIIAICY
jgi:hypothetical protein